MHNPSYLAKALLLVILMSAAGWNATQAQPQRFKAGIAFGLNGSQLQGDDVGGYNRLGLQGGLRAVTILTDKSELVLEMLYSQRGSYSKYGSPKCPNGDISIGLQYVEVPVTYCYKDWYQEEDGYYRLQACGGLSYSRLISAKALGSCHDDLVDKFNQNDVGIVLGVEYFTSPRFLFGARWSRSLTLLYNKDKHDPGRNSLWGYFLSFRGVYLF